MVHGGSVVQTFPTQIMFYTVGEDTKNALFITQLLIFKVSIEYLIPRVYFLKNITFFIILAEKINDKTMRNFSLINQSEYKNI